MMAVVPPSVPRLELYLVEPSNEGVQQLREILTRQTFGAVARRVGVDERAVRKWARGEAEPSMRTRATIARVLGIPVKAWEESPRWPA